MQQYNTVKVQQRGKMASRPAGTGNPGLGTILISIAIIVFVILTFSQIIVIHSSGKFGTRSLSRTHGPFNVESLIQSDAPSVEMSRKIMQNEIYQEKIRRLLQKAGSSVRTRPPLVMVTSSVKNNANLTGARLVRNFTFESSLSTHTVNVTAMSVFRQLENMHSLNSEVFTDDSKRTNTSRQSLSRRQKLCPEVPPNLRKYIFIVYCIVQTESLKPNALEYCYQGEYVSLFR